MPADDDSGLAEGPLDDTLDAELSRALDVAERGERLDELTRALNDLVNRAQEVPTASGLRVLGRMTALAKELTEPDPWAAWLVVALGRAASLALGVDRAPGWRDRLAAGRPRPGP